MVLILELLGTSLLELELAMLLGPLVLYMAVGIAASTKLPIDFFASGRRVPAFFSGLTIAQTALGGTGLVSLTGVFFLVGFDALGIVIGGLAGSCSWPCCLRRSFASSVRSRCRATSGAGSTA